MLSGFFKKSSDKFDREKIAALYLKGDGIEIGALHSPLKVPRSARVTFVDRMPVAKLREQYPELKEVELVEPDVIDDGEKLEKFEGSSLDFIIANHFLEHCQDPIGAVERFLRVLKEGGVLYLAIPDMRSTFDRDRDATTFDHLLLDYREGAENSRRRHFEEWIRVVNAINDDTAEKQIEHCMEIEYSIHYHAWTQAEMIEMVSGLRQQLGFPFELEFLMRNLIDSIEECIFILRKTASVR